MASRRQVFHCRFHVLRRPVGVYTLGVVLFRPRTQRHHLAVIDDNHIIRKRVFNTPDPDYHNEFHNGNRTIVYLNKEGKYKAYDVLTDTETDWNKDHP